MGGGLEYYANIEGSAEWTSVWKSDEPAGFVEIVYGDVRFLYAFVDTAPPVQPLTAKPTASTVLVNAENVAFDAYEIDGYNYFKLRDIGAAFDFLVDWDGANQTIIIDTSAGYPQ